MPTDGEREKQYNRPIRDRERVRVVGSIEFYWDAKKRRLCWRTVEGKAEVVKPEEEQRS